MANQWLSHNPLNYLHISDLYATHTLHDKGLVDTSPLCRVSQTVAIEMYRMYLYAITDPAWKCVLSEVHEDMVYQGRCGKKHTVVAVVVTAMTLSSLN